MAAEQEPIVRWDHMSEDPLLVNTVVFREREVSQQFSLIDVPECEQLFLERVHEHP